MDIKKINIVLFVNEGKKRASRTFTVGEGDVTSIEQQMPNNIIISFVNGSTMIYSGHPYTAIAELT